MSKFSNKIASVALTAVTVVSLSGMSFAPVIAQGATVDELQAQITALLAQIAALQAQLSGVSSGGVAVSCSFTRSLTVGSTGDDVMCLQKYLNGAGFQLAASGAGSPGSETSYFGPITQAAVAKWQAANNVAPAVGYFGPISRAKYSAVAASGSGSGTGSTGGVYVPPPATGVSVSLAGDNPAAGSLISSASASAGRVAMLKFNVTASNSGAVTLTGLKVTRTGVLSDSSISNAYLLEGGKVVAQYSSISGGVVSFNSMALVVNAGQTRTLTFAIDPSTGLTAGNTVAFRINAAADVAAVDYNNTNVTPAGVFPMNGNTFTVTSVSNPSLATLTVASSSVGTAVYAGTQNVLVSQWTLTGANSTVKLYGIKFSVIGSAAKSDLQNVKLYVNGTQVGPTLTRVDANGDAYFDLTSSPATISTGSSNMQVYADIMGSPSFTFDFGILNSYDVAATDSTYNTGVSVTVNGGGTGSTSGHQITINQGAITVSAASDTPTGNIAKNASGVTFAKFTIYAAGEPVKVKWLGYSFVFTGGTGATLDSYIKNVAMYDDAGGQLGSTNSSLTAAGPGGTTAASCTDTSFTAATSTASNCFGSSGSPINYIVPANTTRVLSLRGDVQSGADFSTVVGKLTGNTSNLQGQTSSQSASSGAASGAALTLVTTPLTVAQNAALGTQTYAKGAANVKIGSYTFTGGAAEAINISNLTVTMSASSTDFQNLKVVVGGTQFGNTKNTMTGSDVVTFSGPSFNVPVGGSINVDVYADILSSASTINTHTTLTTLTSCVGTGASTYSSVSCAPTGVGGQNLTVSSGPTANLALSSNTTGAHQVAMGSTNNSLATFRFTDSANIEPAKITTFIVTGSSSDGTATTPGFSNVRLYNNGVQVGNAVSASSTGTGKWVYKFNFANGTEPVVPQNGSLELEVRGDVNTFTSGGATSNKGYQFKIAATSTDTILIGSNSNSSAAVTPTTPTGNTQTTLRTKLTASGAVLGTTSGRTRTVTDDVANLVLTADSGYDATVNTISVKFQGQAISTASAFNVDLIDPTTGTAWSSVTTATCTTASNSCTANFTFSTVPTISAGTAKTVKVRVDSSSFYNNTTAGTEAATVLLNATSAVNWGDGTTTAGLNLETSAIPLTLASVSYE